MLVTLWRVALRIAAASILVFGGLEIFLRATDDLGRNGPAQIRYLMDDEEPLQGQPWYPREYSNPRQLNEAGFRAPSFAPLPGRDARVVVLGDSYVRAAEVPLEQKFTQVAQERVPGVQFLPVGRNAMYLPLQLDFLEGEFDNLFGPENGRYPPADAIILCVRRWGLQNIALGHGEYRVELQPPRWTFQAKQPVQSFLRRIGVKAMLSPSHALSLVGARSIEWLDQDLAKQKWPLTSGSISRASTVIEDAIVPSLVEWARSHELPLGFLYLPSIDEVLGDPSPLTAQARREILGVLRRSGAPYIDASEWFGPGGDQFYAYDHHPNARGHQAMAGALVELIDQLTLSGLQPSGP